MIGHTISHYKILSKLGVGGMGVVYKAEDTRLHRSVALKFLPPELTYDPEAKERFIHEARAASALDHPNICSIYEINETPEGQSYIAMGCYDGETLKQKIHRGAIPLQEVLGIVIQIAEGLSRAHEAGIVHRDIKPANIMITDRGEVKILDFGLAKLGGMTKLTRTGTTIGTAAYMSPEQARGDDVDARTDVWSLGVVLYEMLSEHLPFKSEYEQGLAYLILNETPESLSKHVPDISPDLVRIVNRALEKKPASRYPTVGEMLSDLRAYQDSLRPEAQSGFNLKVVVRKLRRPVVAIPAIACIIVLTLAAVWFIDRQAKIRWAREELLPEIEEMIALNDIYRNLTTPYRLAEQAEKVIPDDPTLARLFSKCSVPISIQTEPPGASVYMKDYDTPDSAWRYLGVTPLEKVRVPIAVLRWKIEKEGFDTVLAASSSWKEIFDFDTAKGSRAIGDPLVRILDKNGVLPPGMVRVPATNVQGLGELKDFYIDKYEVTNRQFKEFIDAGGYRNMKYWEHPFIRDGKELDRERAIKEFVDQTGQPGPATWQAGEYPEGQADFPVAGINWYEASAYAAYAGKSLPTGYHWCAAQGGYTKLSQVSNIFSSYIPSQSNFNGKGPVRVGSLPGVTPYGVYDMAGNVREWCWNEAPGGRCIRGGAWDENTYMFESWGQAPPMDRSPRNGFRCTIYPEPKEITGAMSQPVKFDEPRDFYKEKPVADPIFQVYKDQFSYDRVPLNDRVESREESPGGWVLERITIDAAYGGERIGAYLFLPRNVTPPYQTVIYFPSSSVNYQTDSKNIERYYEFPMFLSWIVKNGRAVLFPVYKGTFERSSPTLTIISEGENSRRYTELVVQIVKDFRRCIDYLETRPDIDTGRLAYFGMSWGALYGAIIPAVEGRLKASVLLGGGMLGHGRPEINEINYVTRVKIPTLMINGRYDVALPYDRAQQPMFDFLGTPAKDKRRVVYETSHVPPRNEYVKETLAWLDRYLGPVK